MNKFGMAVVAGFGAVAMSIAALPAAAATLTFDFTTSGGAVTGSGSSLTRTYTTGAVTLVARGLSLNPGVQYPTSNSTFTAATLGQYGGAGLGVCNSSESSCSSPSHQVDNSYGVDFVLMQLNPAAQINSITVQAYSSTDVDFSFFLGNTANPLNLVGKKVSDLAGLGFGGQQDDTATGSNNSVTLNSATSYNSLLIGARLAYLPYADTNDGFKIRSVIIDYTPPPVGGPVPEPMTLAIFGMGLIGLRAVTRRRKVA